MVITSLLHFSEVSWLSWYPLNIVDKRHVPHKELETPFIGGE